MGCGSSQYVVATNEVDLSVRKLKIAVFGDPGVGKSSICKRYCFNHFSEDVYSPTYQLATYDVTRHVLNYPAAAFREIPRADSPYYTADHFAGIDGAIVVVDLNEPDTVERVGTWRQKLIDNDSFDPSSKLIKEEPLMPTLLLGNKNDLVESKPHEGDEAKNNADQEIATHTELDIETTDKPTASAYPDEVEDKSDVLANFHRIGQSHNFTDSVGVSAKEHSTSLCNVMKTFLQHVVDVNLDREIKLDDREPGGPSRSPLY